MTKKERFLNVLRTFKKPVTIFEWTSKIIEKYPVILNQINSQTNEYMTHEDLITIIASKVSKGEFPEVKVLNSGSYSNIMYTVDNKTLKREVFTKIDDTKSSKKIGENFENFSDQDKYRFDELTIICKQLNKYFKLNFNLYSIESLSNNINNIQLLIKEHSLLKRGIEKRFSIEEQKVYIKRVISLQMMIDKSIDINLTDDVLEMLLDRLEKVY